MKGIEPSLSAWEADVLPLNYTRAHRPDGRTSAVEDSRRGAQWSAVTESGADAISLTIGLVTGPLSWNARTVYFPGGTWTPNVPLVLQPLGIFS